MSRGRPGRSFREPLTSAQEQCSYLTYCALYHLRYLTCLAPLENPGPLLTLCEVYRPAEHCYVHKYVLEHRNVHIYMYATCSQVLPCRYSKLEEDLPRSIVLSTKTAESADLSGSSNSRGICKYDVFHLRYLNMSFRSRYLLLAS